MASYGANILPIDAVHYTLQSATLTNGVLTINAGGSATCNIPTSSLASLTEWFRVSAIATPYSDNYSPTLYMQVCAHTVDDVRYNYTCALTSSGNVATTEIRMEAVAYVELYVRIYAEQTTTITLWELCPEASDADIQTIIDGVQQSLPRLLFDYNVMPLQVGVQEDTIALITCRLIQSTDIQGHFLLTYTASSTCTLTLRFKDNESTELFAPVLYDIQAGRGTIGVPHAYLKRLAGYHNFVVTAQVSTGALTIGTRDLLFTIDGGYLAERALDIGVNISDLTIQQQADEASPSFIWIISVEAGNLLVRRRAYSTQTSGVSFEPMYDLGPAIDGAIEFDGDWVPADLTNTALYRLNTYDAPYCFLVDASHDLYVQLGDDTDSRLLLDSNVTSISACRGFKSYHYIEQDQGVIIAYVKNEQAWYRQYAYDPITSAYIWRAPIQVTEITDPVLSVYVNRLNDYRVTFSITTSTDNYMLISDRTYVGQSYKPEVVDMRTRAFVSVGQFLPDALPGTVEATGDLSDDRLTISVDFNHPIRCDITDVLSALSMPEALRSLITGVSLTDSTMLITVSEQLYAPYTIALDPLYAWYFNTHGQWITIQNAVSFTYDPYGQIATSTDEMVNFNVTPTLSVVQRAIMYPITEQEDTLTLSVTHDIEVVQRAIMYPTSAQDDTLTLTVTATTTVTLLQTGVQPI